MEGHFRGVWIAPVVLLALMVASCDKSQPTPTQPSPPAGTTNPPRAPVVRLELTAPPSIAPEQPAQLTATVVRSDGSVENVTSRAQWSVDDSDVVRVSSGGMATGVQVGEARVSANYHEDRTFYGAISVVVLVPGTHKISGRITDNGTAVSQVAVLVLSGVGVGLTTFSRVDGTFALYGVGGRVSLRASREGYLNKIEELEVTRTVTHDFEIVPDRERTNLSGAYDLTLAMGTCDQTRSGAPLRADIRTRRYTATVTQQGPQLTVTLGGADFILRNGRGNRFTGSLDPIGNVRFTLGDPDDVYLVEYADVVERIDSTTAFMVYGVVNARGTSTGVAGTLSGLFIEADANNPSYWTRSGLCYSDGHLFEMRRQ